MHTFTYSGPHYADKWTRAKHAGDHVFVQYRQMSYGVTDSIHHRSCLSLGPSGTNPGQNQVTCDISFAYNSKYLLQGYPDNS